MWKLSRIDNINWYKNRIKLVEEITKYKLWCKPRRFRSWCTPARQDNIQTDDSPVHNEDPRGSSYGSKSEMALQVLYAEPRSRARFADDRVYVSSSLPFVSRHVAPWRQTCEHNYANACGRCGTMSPACEYSSCVYFFLQVSPLCSVSHGFVLLSTVHVVSRFYGVLGMFSRNRNRILKTTKIISLWQKWIPDYKN